MIPGYEYLEAVPKRRGGRPTVKGTRISVDDILEALVARWSTDEVAENYRIPKEAVFEALRYTLEALKKVEAMAVETTG
jgi:uncharacterized protein (DUF433 family)